MNARGFTLIEIIVTIILMAIMGFMAAQLIATTLRGSAESAGQILPELRQQKAGAEACGRDLEVSAVRRGGKRKVLPRMRHKKAGSAGRWLDVQLRRGE